MKRLILLFTLLPIFSIAQQTYLKGKYTAIRYLFVLLLLVGCGGTSSGDSGNMKQPKCEDMDGLEVFDFDRVPLDFNGLAYCCFEGKVYRFLNYKDGKADGVYREWFRENGQLRIEAGIKKGKEDGVYREWYKKGQLKMEINYKDGKKDGALRRWHENGQLMYETNLEDGKVDGIRRDCTKTGS